MNLTNQIKENPVIRQITREEIESLLSTELSVRKAEYNAATWEKIFDYCKGRIVWHSRRSNLVDWLQEAMEDYYKEASFFILDK